MKNNQQTGILLKRFFRVGMGILFLLLFFQSRSQLANTRLYSTEDGLPSAYIYGIYQDHFGFLWIGTANGLSRFDGRSFVNYHLSDGLPSNNVDRIFEDSAHNLWVGTRAGIARLKGGKLVTYPVQDSIEIRYTFDIMQTRTGAIWALTDQGVFNFSGSFWERVKLLPGNLPTRHIVETDSGMYVNFGKLLAFRDKHNRWKIIYAHPNDPVYFNKLMKTANGILVNTRTTIYEICDNKLVPRVENIHGAGHFNFYYDSMNRLWYYHAYMDKSIRISSKKLMFSMPNHYGIISSCAEDSDGNMWMATSEGLLKIGFTPFAGQLINNNSAFINTIPLPDKRLLFTNRDSIFLGQYNNNTDSISYSFLKKTASAQMDSYASNGEGIVWMLNKSGKMFIYKNGMVTEKNFFNKIGSRERLFSMIYHKKTGRLYISGDSTLYVLDHNGLRHYIPANHKEPLYGYYNLLLTHDQKPIMYSGGEGILMINDRDELVNIFQFKTASRYFLPRNITEDSEHHIWMSDPVKGLLRASFNEAGKLEVKDSITIKNGLQDNTVYAVLADKQNRVWVVTPFGIDIVEKSGNGEWKVFNYSKVAGLSISTISTILTSDQRGNIWLNDWKKTICFKTDQIETKNNLSRIALEKIQLNSRDVAWSARENLECFYHMISPAPVLDYKENTVSFSFNGISFTTGPRIEYSYQLLPNDTSWSTPSYNSTISFVKLSPGKYKFSVKARDQASAWSTPAVFSFVVASPFWMRWWFIILCVAAIVAISYGIYRYRIGELKKLLSIRSKISRDLHDEVGSTLTSINILSKLSLNNLGNDDLRVREMLKRINDQSTSMQQSMSDIVWAVNPNNDSVSTLAVRMREYLGHTVEPEGFEVELKVGEHMLRDELTMEQRQHYFLVFKEAVNNAVKYSKGKKLTIQLIKENHHIRLTIQDDGQGFSRLEHENSNGLRNMHSRATELNGVLKIMSKESGTTVELICPTT